MDELAFRQGAEYAPWDNRALEKASIIEAVAAPFDGYVASIHSDKVGNASMVLGAGRETRESEIDYSAGIVLHKKTGDFVQKGDTLAEFHTSTPEKLSEAKEIFLEAYLPSKTAPVARPLILAYVDSNKVTKY